MEEYEVDYDLEESAQEEPESEDKEADQEESSAGETGEEPEAETDGSEDGQEEEASDLSEEEGSEGETEIVSGNDVVIRGDAIIFPEDYDLSVLESKQAEVDTESIVQAIGAQNNNVTAGFVCTSFVLGVLAGAVIVTGFRLRRV